MSILNAFSTDDPELGVTELADRLGLHKSTVHRFMVNLDAAGLVERNPRTGALPPGAAHLRARRLVMQQMNLWDEALPFLEGLVHDTGETGHLAVLDGGEAIYIERSRPGGPFACPRRSAAATRRTRPTWARSSWPTSPARGCEAIIAERGLAAYTPHTITDPDELEADLELIRRRATPSTTRSTTTACAASGRRCATTPARWWRRSESAAR